MRAQQRERRMSHVACRTPRFGRCRLPTSDVRLSCRALVCGGFAALFLGGLLCSSVGAQQKEENDWKEVISHLTREVRRMPGREETRQQLAVAHNNYAVNLAGQGKLDLATHHLQEAIELDGDGGQFLPNLAGVYLSQGYQEYEAHRYETAREVITKAIEADPKLVAAYSLLGEIEYNAQHLQEAKTAWERVLELDPQRQDVAKRLEQLNDEIPLETTFGRISQAYFDLRYERNLDRPTGFDIRTILRQARRIVGSDFAYWPKRKLVVLVYDAESFREMRQETPEWLAGQFDGKIRLPLPGGGLDMETMKQVLFHEYTHAIVHDMAQGRSPKWFNEGLAEYEGARHGEKRVEYLSAALASEQLIPWESMNDAFANGLSATQVALGYQQSHSIVRYLIERYGFWRIRRILEALASGEELDTILHDEYHIRLHRLQANWRTWLTTYLTRP